MGAGEAEKGCLHPTALWRTQTLQEALDLFNAEF